MTNYETVFHQTTPSIEKTGTRPFVENAWFFGLDHVLLLRQWVECSRCTAQYSDDYSDDRVRRFTIHPCEPFANMVKPCLAKDIRPKSLHKVLGLW